MKVIRPLGKILVIIGSLFSLASSLLRFDTSLQNMQPQTVAIHFLDESSFLLTQGFSTADSLAAAEVVVQGRDIRINGWINSDEGAVVVYSQNSQLNGQFFRMIALPRPDVVKDKNGDSSFLYSGFDFLFGRDEVGQVSCITFQQHQTIIILWRADSNSCAQ